MISLGIDVGGTASRWVALDAQGLEIGRGATPGATGHLFAALERQRFEAMAETIAAHRPSGQVGRIHIGATGLGPAMHGDAAAILSLHLGAPVSAVSCSDDMDLAYRAAFAPGEGHLVSAGTGSIGLHVMADGTLVRVGGRGLLIDDGGSGTWIALNALDRIYRRIDETGAPADAAILARHVFAAIGG
ncbi:BadF/BadG/BcrA/BcrD ATPase family protein, partial [Devosia enhydra]